jgi:hypothetical protein
MIETHGAYIAAITNILENNSFTSTQANILIKMITEHPTMTINELTTTVSNIVDNQKYIFDGHTEYAFDPILMENENINLMEVVIPILQKHIPKGVLCSLTEKHAVVIVNQILDVEFNPTDNGLTLKNKINEMFSAGQITIPIQGLRNPPNSLSIVMNGVFAPLLYRNIPFGGSDKDENTKTLRQALQSTKQDNEDTPLMKLLPQMVITLKKLLKDK